MRVQFTSTLSTRYETLCAALLILTAPDNYLPVGPAFLSKADVVIGGMRFKVERDFLGINFDANVGFGKSLTQLLREIWKAQGTEFVRARHPKSNFPALDKTWIWDEVLNPIVESLEFLGDFHPASGQRADDVDASGRNPESWSATNELFDSLSEVVTSSAVRTPAWLSLEAGFLAPHRTLWGVRAGLIDLVISRLTANLVEVQSPREHLIRRLLYLPFFEKHAFGPLIDPSKAYLAQKEWDVLMAEHGAFGIDALTNELKGRNLYQPQS